MKKYLYLLVSLFALFTLKSHAQCNTWTVLGPDDTIQPSFGPAMYTAITTNSSGQPFVIYADGNINNKATVVTQTAPGTKWTLVGNQGFSAGPTQYNNIAIGASGIIYAAYQDANLSNKAVVMMYSGGTWNPLGTSVSLGPAQYISMAIKPGAKDTVLVAFEDGNKANHVSVYKYNYTNWVPVGVTGFSTGVASYISLQFAYGNLCVAYSDSSYSNKAIVQKFSGTSWGPVYSSSGFSKGAAAYISMGIDGGGNMYVSYEDLARADSIAVMKSNGSAWTFLGNSDSLKPGIYTSLYTSSAGTVYVGYYDFSGAGFATVSVFSGTKWSSLYYPDFSAGTANYINITPNSKSSGQPYVAYQDMLDGGKATVQTTSGSKWINLCTQGISGAYAYTPSIALSPSGIPYVAFIDATNNLERTCVMAYSGNWNYVGLVRSVTPAYSRAPFVAVTNGSDPYVAYQEDLYTSSYPCVKYYNSVATKWESCVSSNDSGYVALTSMNFICMDFDGANHPYVIFDSATKYPEVKRFTGTQWSQVGHVGTGTNIQYPWICYNKVANQPYIAFCDGVTGSPFVMVYNGSIWSVLGGNPVSTGTATYTSMAIDASGNTYVAYIDGNAANNVTVQEYKGGSWNTIGTAGFTASANGCDGARLALDSLGLPYISYIDHSNLNKVTVQKWTGTAWQVVGTTGISQGAAIAPTAMAIKGSSPIVTYQDRGAIVKKFNSCAGSAPIRIQPPSAIICGGSNITLTASPGGVNWLWSTGNTASSITVSPSSTTTYSLVAKNSSGITDTSLTTVTVSYGQNIYTNAGNGVTGYSGDGGPAIKANMNLPTSVAFDAAGNMYIADQQNNVVREVSKTTGIITTIAGNGTAGFGGDSGPATAAELYWPSGLAFDKSGNLYIADQQNSVIRMVNTSGIISTVVGVYPNAGYNNDGILATTAWLNYPTGIAFDNAGNMYIADANNNRVREVIASSGKISTYAGNGVGGLSTGVLATSGELYKPTSVAVDASNNVYIADQNNNRVQEVNFSTLYINTIAGSSVGTAGYTGDGGAATAATLNAPIGVTLDPTGNLYIADEGNNVIREVTTSGTINTIAGNGTKGYSGDNGPATSAELYLPWAVAFDAMGYMYVPDNYNNRVRIMSPCAGPTVTITPSTATICAGQAVTLTANASGALTYSWSPSTGLNNTTSGTVIATPTITTKYIVNVTTSGGPGKDSVTIKVNPSPTVTVTPTLTTICPGGKIKLTASGASTYAWAPSIGLSATTGSPINASPPTSTTYIVTGTISSTGCSNKDSTTIIVDHVTITPVTTEVSCYGGNNGTASVVVDSGAGPFSYSWATGATTSSISSMAGTDTVKVTDKYGCIADMIDTVTQPTPITSTITSINDISCYGGVGSAALSITGGTPGYNYLWSNGATTSNILSVPAGTYTVKITDTHGCIDTTSVTITQPSQIRDSITSTKPACYNMADGTATIGVKGGTPPYTYSWAPSGGTNATATTLAASTSYTVTITDFNGCSVASKAFSIFEETQIRDSAISTTLISCFGGNNGAITMGVKGGSAPYTYLWNNSSSSTISTTTSASGLSTGTYTFIVKDNNGCSDTSTVFFAQPSQLTATSVVMTICPGTSATLNANALGGTKPYTYSWNPTSATSPTINVTPTSNTSYVVTVTDSNNCKASGTDSVKFYPPIITVISSPPSACSGSNVTIFTSSSGGNGGFTYAWYQGSGIIGTGNSVIVAPTTATSYTLITKDACGDTTAKTVTITPKPVPSVTVCCDSTIVVGQSVQLIASSSLTNIFAWMPAAGLSCVNCNTPKATPDITTTYTVTVTDTADGCFVVDTVTITIGTNNIVFYSGITPNGDGKNDTWVIDNINLYPNNTVSIFNRWGTEVWTANNYNNTTVVWDGHDSKGQLLPDATYYYVAKIGNNTYKGWVQLTR